MALSRAKVWGNEILTATDLNAEFDNIINNASSLISPLSGSLDWDGYAHTLDAAGVTTAQSTSSTAWSFTPGSKAGTPSTTGGLSNWSASTWTDSATAGSGTATAWVGHAFQRPTLAASNASVTTTDAATVYIPNAPLAGSNQTLTNPWALWIDAGNLRVDDNIVWLSGTSFRGTLDHANSANRTYTFPDADVTLPGTASQADVNAMTSTTLAMTPNHNKWVLATQVASTSGTNIDFGGLPAGVRQIILMFNGVSLNNTAALRIQLGDAGGIESSGYTGATVNVAPTETVVAGTSGIDTGSYNAATTFTGQLHFSLMDAATFTWSIQGTLNTAADAVIFGYVKATSAELTQLRITTVAGTATFDAGALNISYAR